MFPGYRVYEVLIKNRFTLEEVHQDGAVIRTATLARRSLV